MIDIHAFRNDLPVEGSSPSELQNVRAILMDCGGVLYDDTVWGRWLLQLIGRMGVHTNYTVFFRAFDVEHQPIDRDSDVSYWSQLRRYLLSVGLTHAQIDEVQAAGRSRRASLVRNRKPLPTVTATLSKLAHSGIQLGVLSSGRTHPEGMRSDFRAWKIENCFTLVESLPLMRRRSIADPFQQIARQWQLDPRQTAYVGRCSLELEAASQAGMMTISVDQSVLADVQLDRFNQLAAVTDLEQQLRAG